MTMFRFKTVAFDSTAHYNILPLSPQAEDTRYGMKICSNSFAEKSAVLLFQEESERDAAIEEFIDSLNTARTAA